MKRRTALKAIAALFTTPALLQLKKPERNPVEVLRDLFVGAGADVDEESFGIVGRHYDRIIIDDPLRQDEFYLHRGNVPAYLFNGKTQTGVLWPAPGQPQLLFAGEEVHIDGHLLRLAERGTDQ